MLKLKNLGRLRTLHTSSVRMFGGGGHKEYDWRDDPKYNKDLYIDPRHTGWNPENYVSPYEGKTDWRFPEYPENFDFSNVALNLRPDNKKSDQFFTEMQAPYWTPEADFNHEADYESEDLDFQGEDFKLQLIANQFVQHFRKKGPFWPYLILANLFFIYFGLEFIYQKYPDEDHWRISRSPPLDQPDPEDNDDTDTFNENQTKDIRKFRDTGTICDIWFDIVDGKKVIRPFAGANQPQEDDI